MTRVDTPALPPEAAAAQMVFQIATGHIVASALRSALIFNIPDRVAAGPRPVADLAKDAGANEDALYRVLRALTSLGIFEETAPRTFGPALPSRMLQSGPGSLRGLVRWISDSAPMRVHAAMEYSVKTGKPAAEQVLGLPVFEWFAGNPETSEIFNEGMTSFSAVIVPAVIEAYDFSGITTLADIAGGHGQVLTSVLQKYPSMRGILFDLDHVVAGATPKIAAAGLASRCMTASGDFFTEVPDADAYVLKHIIHDWDDERALAILTNIRKRLAGHAGGRVLLIESVIQPGSAPDLGKIIDLEMLVLPGGRERTADDFAALFTRAGLTLTRIVPTKSPVSIIEGRLA